MHVRELQQIINFAVYANFSGEVILLGKALLLCQI